MKSHPAYRTKPRPYVSKLRADAAAERRGRVIQSALQLLREEAGIANFSLDAVAKAAGLTRLTVYNQFGSRRGLLEAVFDEIAAAGGLVAVQEAMRLEDPLRGLDRFVEIFCAFWAHDAAIDRLHDAMALEPELALALASRHESRRKLLQVLVRRIHAGTASARHRRETVDMLFACTSQAMYRMLAPGRSAEAVCAMVRRACRAAVERDSA